MVSTPHDDEARLWIKAPGPGQFRGEGEWKTIAEAGASPEDWVYCHETGYLPAFRGPEKPTDEEYERWRQETLRAAKAAEGST